MHQARLYKRTKIHATKRFEITLNKEVSRL